MADELILKDDDEAPGLFARPPLTEPADTDTDWRGQRTPIPARFRATQLSDGSWSGEYHGGRHTDPVLTASGPSLVALVKTVVGLLAKAKE